MTVETLSTAELLRRVSELEQENQRLRGLLGFDRPERLQPPVVHEPRLLSVDSSRRQRPLETVSRASLAKDKVALFRSLFVGRDDVYAVRWESARSGKTGWSPAVKGGWANARRPDREYLVLTDDVIASHLAGEIRAGTYPLMRGDRCVLLACDFDGSSWVLDALAYYDAAAANGVPVALERSRSGDGAHVWTFFDGPVAASDARRIGVALLRDAMASRAEIDLASYDRLFPAQDFLPKGTFGNLIALPLQGDRRRAGRTVFLDAASLEPVEDQWAFLSQLPRLSPDAVASLAAALGEVEAGPGAVRARRRPATSGTSPEAPPTISATAGAMLAVQRIGLPPPLVASLKHLASLHNPIFYEKERLRFSTHDTPRFIRCYRENIGEILLPRGVQDEACRLVEAARSQLDVRAVFEDAEPVGFALRSRLSAEQQSALDALLDHDLGVLVAPPGAGKTVVACALIARRDVPTLVIVDRKPLLEQWRERLASHLGLTPKEIGRLETSQDRQRGMVDLTMAQGLARREDVAEVTARYGLVVVDECHHVPAVSFERCVRQAPVRCWLGLTATPYRRDGLQALITMYCGPIRHDMTQRVGSTPFVPLELHVHQTSHDPGNAHALSIQATFRALVEDDTRTEQLCANVANAVARGRNCLVLTQWSEHLVRVADSLRGRGVEPLVLRGGIGKKAHNAIVSTLSGVLAGEGVAVVATGSYLGEGFDCPPLDTLFLAFPIAFKGRLVQYVGRVLRPADRKASVEVHDYIDLAVPVLERMHAKRLPVFAALGFRAS